VRVSTELVASSRIKIFGSARITRAMVNNCFCPCEILSDSSFRMVIVAVRQCMDEFVAVGGLRCGYNLLAGCAKRPVTNVIEDGSVIQPGILQDHAETDRKSFRASS